MHLALFGATGRTGSRVLALALQRGWTVTVLARNPQKMSVTHEHLTVIAGETSDEDALQRTLTHAGAAVIALGTGTNLRPTHNLSDATAQIVEAMEGLEIKRVVCLLSGWLFYPVVPPPFVELTRDHARQLAILEATRLQWVAVCPPALVDRPARSVYKVTLNGLPGAGYQEIGVDDLADFLLRATIEESYVRQKVGVAD